MRLSYRVTTDASPIRHGNFADWQQTTQELADQLADETRASQPYITGALDIHIWPSRPDEHYRMPLPDDAELFPSPCA